MAHTQAPKDKLNGNQEEVAGAYESSLAMLLKSPNKLTQAFIACWKKTPANLHKWRNGLSAI